jgi:hypothetical protein
VLRKGLVDLAPFVRSLATAASAVVAAAAYSGLLDRSAAPGAQLVALGVSGCVGPHDRRPYRGAATPPGVGVAASVARRGPTSAACRMRRPEPRIGPRPRCARVRHRLAPYVSQMTYAASAEERKCQRCGATGSRTPLHSAQTVKALAFTKPQGSLPSRGIRNA